jgi:ABC-type Mn2+/Zn2+ transport system permease subunit
VFSLTFVQIAFLATVCVALTCGFLSPVVVLRQRAYLSETLSHLVFPGVVAGVWAAGFFEVSLWWGVWIGAAVTALLGFWSSERITSRLKIPADAGAIVVLTAFFALGVILLSQWRSSRFSLDNLLFGDVLILSWVDVGVLAAVAMASGAFVFGLKKHWNAWLTDVDFAQLMGFRVRLVGFVFPILLTAAVLSGLFAMGGLMMAALLTLPTVLTEPKTVGSWQTLVASLVLCLGGFFLAFFLNWPVGPTIVLLGFFGVLVRSYARQSLRS